ncbi:hypothetical protein GV827_16220 [Sulfitobacter sp. JBTF-M27]|uniref:Uncharacterized protein n=1 Tax=Sulfitobacter sediminilitoris TaxID=2698830 RepID=A0A6P0CDI2_9RHOB|nr:hypothetical protein [Sulfitobacter sediminilitoris]NEK23937.1 hypothetical protein [Sulfitobacter sediminilitoris]
MIQADKPETYIRTVDKVLQTTLSAADYESLTKIDPRYIDDAISCISSSIDLVALYTELNLALANSSFRVFHGTRLTLADAQAIERDGLKPLRSTDREKRLHSRIEMYASNRGIPFNKMRFWELCEEYRDRDKGRIYATLHKAEQLANDMHYTKYGSEFEHVIVVNLLGNHHKKLLQLDTQPALVSWITSGANLVDETTIAQVADRLAEGNRPELSSHFLDRALLWLCGRANDISYLSKNYSLSFSEMPSFEGLRIEWL